MQSLISINLVLCADKKIVNSRSLLSGLLIQDIAPVLTADTSAEVNVDFPISQSDLDLSTVPGVYCVLFNFLNLLVKYKTC